MRWPQREEVAAFTVFVPLLSSGMSLGGGVLRLVRGRRRRSEFPSDWQSGLPTGCVWFKGWLRFNKWLPMGFLSWEAESMAHCYNDCYHKRHLICPIEAKSVFCVFFFFFSHRRNPNHSYHHITSVIASWNFFRDCRVLCFGGAFLS